MHADKRKQELIAETITILLRRREHRFKMSDVQPGKGVFSTFSIPRNGGKDVSSRTQLYLHADEIETLFRKEWMGVGRELAKFAS